MDKDEKLEALESLLGGNPRAFCASWTDAVDQAGTDENKWRCDQANEAVKVYEGDVESNNTAFNIFHSNVETLVPALYNSSPIPDVRRRFNDDDKVAAQLSTIIERAIGFSIDDYDFDDTMLGVVKDMAVVDRGMARVKYDPTFGNDGRTVLYEAAPCEYVPWELFRRGPATQWGNLPWLAFIHFLDRKEVTKLVQGEPNVMAYDEEQQQAILTQLTFSYSPESKSEKNKDAKPVPTFAAREMVYEIWDKETRQVIWLSADYGDMPLAIHDDPLQLKQFFPTPRPAMIVRTTRSLTPITSYSIYVDLVDQLNRISERIDALVEQVRVRGGYVAVDNSIELIAKADDGTLTPIESAEIFATTGGDINKAIMWWPLEMVYKALEVLVQQREVVKATIYEVTGMSDIVRGASDPNETATAQEIKSKWGSIRIQAHQKEVERYARDLFRLKAEIMCKHFQMSTLLSMTGLKYPTQEEKQRAEAMKAQGEQALQAYQQQAQAAQQAGQEPPPPPIPEDEFKRMQEQVEEILAKPTVEEIEALMRDNRVLKYRVDIESDSTVRADLTKNQAQMKDFLDGTAAYAGAVGPMVQEGIMPGEVAVGIYASFTRNFRLGKTAEDLLDEWSEKIKKEGVQGKPPDPNVQAEADLKVAQAEKTRTEAQILPEAHKLETAKVRGDLMIKARTAENSENAAANEFELKKRSTHEDITDRRADRDTKRQEIDDRHEQSTKTLEQQDRHHSAALDETRASREQSGKLEKLKLRDGRSARKEGYQAAQVPNEQGHKPPVPEMEPLEDEMDGGETGAQILQGLQTIAEGQAQMAQTLEALAAAITQAMGGQTQAPGMDPGPLPPDAGPAAPEPDYGP